MIEFDDSVADDANVSNLDNKTGTMNDPGLTERLYKSGAKFEKNIEQTMSPMTNFLVTGLLPLVIFIALGQYFSRKIQKQMGGKNALLVFFMTLIP